LCYKELCRRFRRQNTLDHRWTNPDMSITSHESALERIVTRQCGENPELAARLVAIAGSMNGGEYPRESLDEIVQRSSGLYSIQDAYCLLRIMSALQFGALAFAHIDAGETPHRDSMVEENNAALTNLPGSFKAEFWGGKGDYDGHLEWSDPEPFYLFKVGVEDEHITFLKDGWVPLEVGYTKSSRTLLHLAEDRGLARWPYDSHRITVFKVVKAEGMPERFRIDG
jgi:hypothetical protein